MLSNLVSKHFSSVRKKLSFRSHGLNWRREDAELTHVISFQSSRFTEPSELSFTINVGVMRGEVRELVWPDKVGSKIDVSDCFPNARAGHLGLDSSRSNGDLWWHWSKSKLSNKTVQQITSYIECECEAYFRAFSLPENVLSAFEPKVKKLLPLEKLNLAAYQILYGDRLSGIHLITEVAEAAPAWSERTTMMLGRLDTLPD